ncbi:TetR/AcrR family transcriptional regulator [Pseudomonas gingeri]|uniref:TetR/AcrR family transcriptional regulator n=1 Tax=Pseudomonas gingeri TaxID=117681 RepID=A0A7Y7XHI6_9PSED|nr:TetR/AcrR family transcriptional regulator [Pseudomonas gingeri]NWC00014.1 TetR/AcrR family transcriptional regulator [Pseudomonas gingeri]
MTEPSKRARAIDAGARAFMQHGFARTTMGVIAESAAMSRPALYLLFKNKEQVLEAVVDTWTEQTLTKMSAAIAELPNLADKLREICAMWSVASFERSQNNPQLRDLVGHPAYEKGYARFMAFIAHILDESSPSGAKPISCDELARGLVLGIRGFKVSAASMDDLLHLIDVQVRLIEAYLQKPVERP